MRIGKKPKTYLLRLLKKVLRLSHFKPSSDETVFSQSRREFLQKTGSLAAFLSTTGLLPSYSPLAFAKSPQPIIAIVGGGLAGLNAAYHLQRSGYTSTIFEASQRTGGRISTAKDIMAEGLVTELGGEFIELDHKDIIYLAKDLHLTLLNAQPDTDLTGELFIVNNQEYTLEQVTEAFAPYAESIQADVDELPDSISYHTSAEVKTLDNLSIAQYLDQKKIKGWLRTLLEIACVAEYGLEITEQSAINLLLFFTEDSSEAVEEIFGNSVEYYRIAGGNQRITDKLTEKLQGHIEYDAPLTALKSTDNGYTLSFANKQPDYYCDIALLTLPFSILREIDIQVPLPTVKRKCINELGYATHTKLMVGMQKRVWQEAGYVGYLSTDQGVQVGWDNSQLQSGQSGGYTIFLGGQAGIRASQDTPKAQLSQYLPVLDKAFPDFSNQLNSKIERLAWMTQPYHKGSYACYKVGQWTTIAGAERETVGNLFFAGEHCSVEFQGFMNGAAESGRKVAHQIVAVLEKKAITTDED